ncbi:MAG: GNAT family N-acetyltransferase [Candidatus Coprovivens sp.]
MIFLKKANLEDIEEEYNFLSKMPSINGFENEYENLPRENFEQHIKALIDHSEGKKLKEGYVPDTYFFLWDDNKIVGVFKLRHYLNDWLRKNAGHLGYGILPEENGKGYATKGLALMKKEAAKIIKENEIYLSVHKDNKASLKVQQKNGAYIVKETENEYLTRIKIR